MRIGGEAPRRRTHSRNRFQNHGLLRVTATSDRHRTMTMFCSSASESSSFLSLLPHAARNTTPAGTSPVVTRRHKAISNLRARATIIVFRFLPPSVRVRYHWANALSFRKSKKRQANCIIPPRTRALPALASPFSRRLLPTLVGCASETIIARYGSSIPQFPREDLVHQHVRRFYTNTNNAGDQSDHRVWSITGRLLHTLQASLLDLADLITDEPPALHVAMQLS